MTIPFNQSQRDILQVHVDNPFPVTFSYVAKRVYLSAGTTRVYYYKMYEYFDVNTRVGLFHALGWIQPNQSAKLRPSYKRLVEALSSYPYASNNELMDVLGIQLGTIRDYTSNIYGIYGVHNRWELFHVLGWYKPKPIDYKEFM